VAIQENAAVVGVVATVNFVIVQELSVTGCTWIKHYQLI